MLKEKILEDLKLSLKKNNEVRTGTLRLLLSAVKNKEIEKRGSGRDESLTDEEVLEIIGREIKKRKEATELYVKGNRSDLASREEAEMKELQDYLPPQLSEKEIKEIVKKIIEIVKPSSAKDFGKVMGLVSKETKMRADGSVVSAIVKDSLNG